MAGSPCPFFSYPRAPQASDGERCNAGARCIQYVSIRSGGSYRACPNIDKLNCNGTAHDNRITGLAWRGVACAVPYRSPHVAHTRCACPVRWAALSMIRRHVNPLMLPAVVVNFSYVHLGPNETASQWDKIAKIWLALNIHVY